MRKNKIFGFLWAALFLSRSCGVSAATIFSPAAPALPSAMDFHAFHLSKCDIEYSVGQKSLQVTLHVFIDDLEAALRKQGRDHLFVGSEREVPSANGFIAAYLQEKLIISVNQKKQKAIFLGKETTKDLSAVWIYLEIKDVSEIRDIFVEDKLLTEVFDDQKNIVQIKASGKKGGYFILDKNKTSETTSLDR